MATTITKLFPTGILQSSVALDEVTLSSGQAEFTTPGTYSWTAPAGVTSVSVVAIGPGATNAGGGGGLTWANGLNVTPGQSYTVVVGAGGYTGSGSTSSNCSSFNWPACIALGGGSGGGTGGPGGRAQDVSGAASYGGGSGGNWGGGAGGYAGNGGVGYGSGNTSNPGANGSGGGGGGGGNQAFPNNGGGGGTGIYGQGSDGVYPGGGGSGGGTSSAGGTASVSGLYGGGGVYSGTSKGGNGAVRIIWGTGRSFPSTNTADVSNNTIKISTSSVQAVQFDEVSLGSSTVNAGSIQFNGSSQYLSLPGTAIPLSGTTFTAECWVYLTGYSSLYNLGNYGAGLLTTTNTSGANGGNFGLQWTIRGTASSWTALGVYANNGSISYNASYSFSLNTWYHVAVTHTSAGAWNLFVNGTSIGTTSNATTWTDNTPYAIGRNNQSGYEYYFPGYISNFRLVAGSVVYPSNFTTPTSTLTAISGTALLLNTTNDANYLKDSSTNNITITAVGSPVSSSLVPFINPAERRTSTGTYQVSGYFDEYTYTIAPF